MTVIASCSLSLSMGGARCLDLKICPAGGKNKFNDAHVSCCCWRAEDGPPGEGPHGAISAKSCRRMRRRPR